MNAKYREVPRYPKAKASYPAARFKGVSTGAIAAREAEQARELALAAELGITNFAFIAAGLLTAGVFFDATAWATMGWGYSERDGEYTQVGLWRICRGQLETSAAAGASGSGRAGGADAGASDAGPDCVFPTNVNQDWIFKGLVMEIMGGFCAIGLLIALCIFLASLKCTGVQSRTMIIIFIPLAFLAALMNFIGLLTFALNVNTIRCHPSYSIALDTFGTLGFAAGGLCALFEIQGCFRESAPDPEIAPPAAIHRPVAAGMQFATS